MPCGSFVGSPSSAQRRVEPGLARLLDELVDVLEARLRDERRRLLGPAQHADEAAHLGERGAAGLLDGLQRLALALLVLAQQPPHRRGLHRHHAHGVADDVVQLARDAGALLGDGRARLDLSLELESLGALAQLLRLPRARAEEEPDEPGGDEEAADPRDLPEPVVELEHDVRDRRERDRNARVRDPPLLRRAEGRHRPDRAEEGKRQVVAGLVRHGSEHREGGERRRRRAEREAVAQEQQRRR